MTRNAQHTHIIRKYFHVARVVPAIFISLSAWWTKRQRKNPAMMSEIFPPFSPVMSENPSEFITKFTPARGQGNKSRFLPISQLASGIWASILRLTVFCDAAATAGVDGRPSDVPRGFSFLPCFWSGLPLGRKRVLNFKRAKAKAQLLV